MFLLFGCTLIVTTTGRKIKGKSEKNAKKGGKSQLTRIFFANWDKLFTEYGKRRTF